MICIYRGTGPTDAYLVRDWLERNEIRVQVRGQALLGAIGQVPLVERWPTVWVHPRDKERAEQALRVFEGPTLVHPDWICPACDEENAATFGSCWSCGAEKPAG